MVCELYLSKSVIKKEKKKKAPALGLHTKSTQKINEIRVKSTHGFSLPLGIWLSVLPQLPKP